MMIIKSCIILAGWVLCCKQELLQKNRLCCQGLTAEALGRRNGVSKRPENVVSGARRPPLNCRCAATSTVATVPDPSSKDLQEFYRAGHYTTAPFVRTRSTFMQPKCTISGANHSEQLEPCAHQKLPNHFAVWPGGFAGAKHTFRSPLPQQTFGQRSQRNRYEVICKCALCLGCVTAAL